MSKLRYILKRNFIDMILIILAMNMILEIVYGYKF